MAFLGSDTYIDTQAYPATISRYSEITPRAIGQIISRLKYPLHHLSILCFESLLEKERINLREIYKESLYNYIYNRRGQKWTLLWTLFDAKNLIF